MATFKIATLISYECYNWAKNICKSFEICESLGGKGSKKNLSHFVEPIAVVLMHLTECQNSTRMSKFLGLEDMTNLIFVGLDFCIGKGNIYGIFHSFCL